MAIFIDHIALLVESIENTIKALPASLQAGKIESFASEGTREAYVRHPVHSSASILLMQAEGDGPYRRALQKRGPGLHHICIKVEDIGRFVEQIASSGFLLHPKSLKTVTHGVVYLCRPGIPFLVEVEAMGPGAETNNSERLVGAVGLPVAEAEQAIITRLFGDYIFFSSRPTLRLNCNPAVDFFPRENSLAPGSKS